MPLVPDMSEPVPIVVLLLMPEVSEPAVALPEPVVPVPIVLLPLAPGSVLVVVPLPAPMLLVEGLVLD